MSVTFLHKRVRTLGAQGLPLIDPITLPNKVLLLRSQTISGNDGDPVTNWVDESGNGRNCFISGGFDPVLRTVGQTTPNGTRTVDFRGGRFLSGNLPVGGVDQGLGFSYYLYYNLITNTGASQRLLVATVSPSTFLIADAQPPSTVDYVASRDDNSEKSFQPAVLGWQAMSYLEVPPRGASGTVQMYRDGNALALTAGAPGWDSNFNTLYTLGGNGLTALDAVMACVAVFNEVHNGPIRRGVERWMRATYG